MGPHLPHRVQHHAAILPIVRIASIIESELPPEGSTKALYRTPGNGGSSYRPATTAASTTSRETKSARSLRHSANHSAAATSESRSSAASMTDCGRVGLNGGAHVRPPRRPAFADEGGPQ